MRSTRAGRAIIKGGSSTVVVNQQEDGGEWQLLGTYNFDPSANHRIELDDEANGTVVADAVYVVSASTVQNSVTWEPTIASSALVDVYAKWIDSADRSDAVSYTVHHAGGSTAVNMNQKQNGGTWNWLGQFTMNPASNHRVEVTDSTDGIVVADAVRFVSVTTSGAGLMYVHSDHLGTPQKMTDGSQTLVWDAVYQPFGNVHSITGTASNNQRFPGQYFDSESGFSNNYFRDYDSTTGRYVQSDPIGLRGGPNLYSYVISNPLTFIDPLGLYTSAQWSSEPSLTGITTTYLGDMGIGDYWTLLPPAIGLEGSWWLLKAEIKGVVECLDKDNCGGEKKDTFDVEVQLGKKVGIGYGITTFPWIQGGRKAGEALSSLADAVEFYQNVWTQRALSIAKNPMAWCILMSAKGN